MTEIEYEVVPLPCSAVPFRLRSNSFPALAPAGRKRASFIVKLSRRRQSRIRLPLRKGDILGTQRLRVSHPVIRIHITAPGFRQDHRAHRLHRPREAERAV